MRGAEVPMPTRVSPANPAENPRCLRDAERGGHHDLGAAEHEDEHADRPNRLDRRVSCLGGSELGHLGSERILPSVSLSEQQRRNCDARTTSMIAPLTIVIPPMARRANNTTDATLIGAYLRTVAESTFKGTISAPTAKPRQTLATTDPTRLPMARLGDLAAATPATMSSRDAGAEAADQCGGNRRADRHRGRDTCQGDHELIAADGEHNQAPE